MLQALVFMKMALVLEMMQVLVLVVTLVPRDFRKIWNAGLQAQLCPRHVHSRRSK